MKYLASLCTGLLLGTLLSTLAGCGQSGPLYLPDDEPSKKAAKTAMFSVENPAFHGRL